MNVELKSLISANEVSIKKNVTELRSQISAGDAMQNSELRSAISARDATVQGNITDLKSLLSATEAALSDSIASLSKNLNVQRNPVVVNLLDLNNRAYETNNIYFKGFQINIDVAVTDVTDQAYKRITIHLLLLKYDAELNWPSSIRLQLTLLNQLEDKNHYTHIWTADTDTKYGIIINSFYDGISDSNLAYNEELNRAYLVDDRLYCRLLLELPN